MTTDHDPQARFIDALERRYLGDELFDAIPDTVFFLKDHGGRYVAVNRTLVLRAGRHDKHELIGRTASEVFPGILGERIEAQDRAVVRDGRPIHGKLELHMYAGGTEGWCLTWKEPLIGRGGKVAGLSGISRDLQPIAGTRDSMDGISRIIDHVHGHLDTQLRLPDLAALAEVTVYQLDARIRGLFGLSAGQYLTRARIERACSRLRQTDQPISQIALDCGYGDQAAFTRQFNRSVGLTPSQYRKRNRLVSQL